MMDEKTCLETVGTREHEMEHSVTCLEDLAGPLTTIALNVRTLSRIVEQDLHDADEVRELALQLIDQSRLANNLFGQLRTLGAPLARAAYTSV